VNGDTGWREPPRNAWALRSPGKSRPTNDTSTIGDGGNPIARNVST